MAKNTKRLDKQIDQNPVEAIRDLGGAVVESVKDDLGREMINTLWDQLLGAKKEMQQQTVAASGDLQEGQEISFKTAKKQEKAKANIEPAINYSAEIIHAEKRINMQENHEMAVRIEEIIVELKNLTKSSKALEIEFKDVVVQEMPVVSGKYHENFFEWMLTTIKSARMRIEDSANWISVVMGKKNKKEYWALFKKHGTSFGLSGERVVATQAG